MADSVEQRNVEMKLHPDRKLVTPMDQFTGGDFLTGLVISGAIASNNRDVLSGGGILQSVVSGSVVKVRPVNIEMRNEDSGWMEVEFRDGGWTGGRVAGPYTLQPKSERTILGDQLVGKYFTSSVFLAVLSGYTGQPLANGIKVNMGFVKEPLDFYQ